MRSKNNALLIFYNMTIVGKKEKIDMLIRSNIYIYREIIYFDDILLFIAFYL